MSSDGRISIGGKTVEAYEDTSTLSRSGTHAPADSTADVCGFGPLVEIHSAQREPT